MPRPQRSPLRELSSTERASLERLVRARTAPVEQVARATILLSVADGLSFTAAARRAGRSSSEAVAQLVGRFNRAGLEALTSRHGGGHLPSYGPAERDLILAEARRSPDPDLDGTGTWSLSTLQRSVRARGLPRVSTYTIWRVLHEAGLSWQRSRTWCETGQASRKRKAGTVVMVDEDAEAKKHLIEHAYREGERLGLAVWVQDEAGPYQAIPQPGPSWQPEGQPIRQPHEYIRGGTAKLLTLFHPASGELRAEGVTSSANAVLHPWLEGELTAVLAALPALPEQATLDPEENRALWARWEAGLKVKLGLLETLPPLRALLVLDNLKGHKTNSLVVWLLKHGVMPLYTPIAGSWLNMAESIQRIITRRALAGYHPKSAAEVIERLEGAVRGWNRHPTVFTWGGKRHARRERAWVRRRALGGSGATVSHSATLSYGGKYLQARQLTH